MAEKHICGSLSFSLFILSSTTDFPIKIAVVRNPSALLRLFICIKRGRKQAKSHNKLRGMGYFQKNVYI